MHSLLLLLVIFVSCSLARNDPSLLYPYTLLDTPIACKTVAECHAANKHSWCNAGFICLNNQCKTIPDFPCRSTQECDEKNYKCHDSTCKVDSDCDNGVFCDGREICQANVCIMDPEEPSCAYLGGLCDEVNKRCSLPENNKDRYLSVKSFHALQNGTETPLSSSTVNITSVTIIGAVIGVFFLVVIVLVLGKSARGIFKQSSY